MKNIRVIREKILSDVRLYTQHMHVQGKFVSGETYVPPSGPVFDSEEITALVDSALNFWFTADKNNDEFERKLQEFINIKFVLTTNSGSSASLLSVAALSSDSLGDRALKPGDEVITVAAGFPTTVNPLLIYGLVPVFVDIQLPTYNIQTEALEEAITEKTKAIMLAHTLGNPFDLEEITRLAEKYNLWLIEDCCDALGSTYKNKNVGTFGDISTFSFFPAHHITTGEGGAVATGDGTLKRNLEKIRGWGRDCFCKAGQDNSCGKRFDWKFDGLPYGYDHKYVFTELGFNLKITDLQAALGIKQMDKVLDFIIKRKANFQYLKESLFELEKFFILPESTRNSDPSWFGFPLTIREGAPFTRRDLLTYLSDNKVGTRLLFGGNLTKQPYFKNRSFRVFEELTNTDLVMNNAFWLGIFPGITNEMLDYVSDIIFKFVKK